MDITFITDSAKHSVSYKTVDSKEGRNLILSSLEDAEVISLDYETNGLDPYKNQLLLTALKIKENYYVIDNTTIRLDYILHSTAIENKEVIAHHAKFEYKFSKTNGLVLKNLYCTMIAEQRLIMGTGYSASIVETCKRRSVPLPEGMDKDIRETFIDAVVDEIIFTDEQILYAVSDIIPLEAIKQAQQLFIDAYNMNHLIYNIEMPLISILAESELDGFKHDSNKWIAYAKKKEAEAQDIVKELDQLAINAGANLEEINPEIIKRSQSKVKKLERLKDRQIKLEFKLQDLDNREKSHLKSYEVMKNTWESVCDEIATLETQDDEEEYIGINWSSSDQVIKVFQSIKGFPIPTDKNKVTKQMQPSVGKEARSTWYSLHGNSKFVNLFDLFHSYKKITHNVNSFGEKWVKQYINTITGKVHTYFKQCNTGTGRLASGDAKNGWFNGQQIPTIEDLRSCFVVDDDSYELLTLDLSSAELVCMSSLANDTHLYELFVKYDDIHSSILTKAWRKIHKYRGNLDICDSFIVSKTVNADLRKKGKNGTFAVVYGAYPAKLATTLDISVPEANLYIEAVKEEIQPTIKYVESKTKQALSEGYVIHNKRTNSRRWFTSVIESNKYGNDLSFKDESEVVSAARNTSIQGTQADMVKEAMVVINNWIIKNNLDVKLKLQVHDELVYQFPKGLEIDGKSFAEHIKYLLTSTADLYLNEGFNMGADYHIAKYWLK
jgi:DNA polymerase I-like protein with 3'-5' exonuclease and polymerase domains